MRELGKRHRLVYEYIRCENAAGRDPWVSKIVYAMRGHMSPVVAFRIKNELLEDGFIEEYLVGPQKKCYKVIE